MVLRRLIILGSLSLTAGVARAQSAPDPLPWARKLIAAARAQVGVTLHYDPNYTKLSYPNGDVPMERGVCTDVIIRAYRQGLGLDLQKLVHEDMQKNFAAYPQKWGLKEPDSNIDHRRVPNLQTYFSRRHAALPLSTDARDYQPADIITMDLPGHLTHIALIVDDKTSDGQRHLCIHNIGEGAKRQDVLFAFPLTGHYRLSA